MCGAIACNVLLSQWQGAVPESRKCAERRASGAKPSSPIAHATYSFCLGFEGRVWWWWLGSLPF